MIETKNDGTWIMTTNREDWLKMRLGGIGGSDSASVMGLNNYEEEYIDAVGNLRRTNPYSYIDTPFVKWLEKTGDVPKKVEPNIAIEMGVAMEPRILAEFERTSGQKLLPKPSIIRHSIYPFILASLDGWTEDTIVEAKCGRWTPKWGDDGSNVIPLNYWMQVQHYMLATGYRKAVVVALLYSNEGVSFRTYYIDADNEWHDACIRRYMEFWEAVKNHIPPATYNLNDIKYRFPRAVPLSKIEATPMIVDDISRLKELKERQTEMETELTQRKESVLRFMQDNESLTYNGQIIATYKNTKRGNRVFTIK